MPPRPPGPNGSIMQPSISAPGGTTVAPVLPISSQPVGQIGPSQVTSVTNTSGPPGSQTRPSLAGQVVMFFYNDTITSTFNTLALKHFDDFYLTYSFLRAQQID